MTKKSWGNEYRSTMVCVDSYEKHILSGSFYNPFQTEGERFSSMMELVLKMEQLLNTMSCPQSFSAVRTFTHTEAPAPPTPAPARVRGALASFEVRVLFRQNASWQGCVTWLEENREAPFRSVLELLVLMDSALQVHRREPSPT